MNEIEKYARAAASTARTPPNSPARHAAIEAENAARVAAEQFAANQAQRIADLETKVATLKRLHDAVVAERDELRARLDEIEVQEPVAWATSSFMAFRTAGERSLGIFPGCTTPLYARPVPAIQDGWQPIKDAPKDQVILLAFPRPNSRLDRFVYEGRWHADQETWTGVSGFLVLTGVTHWMPFPAAPEAAR